MIWQKNCEKIIKKKKRVSFYLLAVFTLRSHLCTHIIGMNWMCKCGRWKYQDIYLCANVIFYNATVSIYLLLFIYSALARVYSVLVCNQCNDISEFAQMVLNGAKYTEFLPWMCLMFIFMIENVFEIAKLLMGIRLNDKTRNQCMHDESMIQW